MSDYFARIGRVLEALVSVSTINGDIRAEANTLIGELKSASDNLTKAVEERVLAASEAVAGRVDVLERGRERVDAIVFSNANAASLGISNTAPSDDAEKERLEDLFKGGDPVKVEPAPPEPESPAVAGEVIDEMTVAELKVELGRLEIPFSSKATKAELQNLLAGVPDGASTEAAPVS